MEFGIIKLNKSSDKIFRICKIINCVMNIININIEKDEIFIIFSFPNFVATFSFKACKTSFFTIWFSIGNL